MIPGFSEQFPKGFKESGRCINRMLGHDWHFHARFNESLTMPTYISEMLYYGHSNTEFIEVAVPAGTDTSGFGVIIYDDDGEVTGNFRLGAVQNTMAGHDVYVVDDTTPGFATPVSGGNLYLGYGVALMDGDGNVQQFVSYWGRTVEAQEGPADGMTSVDIGYVGYGGSLISIDGGASYVRNYTPTSGSIPACYAPGTMIDTQSGPRPIEQLRAGDIVMTQDGGPQALRWVWSGTQPLEQVQSHQKPVLISKGALGHGIPDRDLVVSGQHRIVAGLDCQLPGFSSKPVLVPAKALTTEPGVRHMKGTRSILWHHVMCDSHHLIRANGTVSETLLPGPVILGHLDPAELRDLTRAFGRFVLPDRDQTPVLDCLSVGETRRRMARARHVATSGAALKRSACRKLVTAP